MAFIATYNTQTVPSRPIVGAYIRASIARADKYGTVIKLEIWKSLDDRITDPEKPYETDVAVFQPDTQVEASGSILPIAYSLLEQSGLFPDAQWNQ